MNLCSLDLSNAFDQVNHHAFFTKLMNPINLLCRNDGKAIARYVGSYISIF
jgi:hypothetical protein